MTNERRYFSATTGFVFEGAVMFLVTCWKNKVI